MTDGSAQDRVWFELFKHALSSGERNPIDAAIAADLAMDLMVERADTAEDRDRDGQWWRRRKT